MQNDINELLIEFNNNSMFNSEDFNLMVIKINEIVREINRLNDFLQTEEGKRQIEKLKISNSKYNMVNL
jgi:hypothetical protein